VAARVANGFLGLNDPREMGSSLKTGAKLEA